MKRRPSRTSVSPGPGLSLFPLLAAAFAIPVGIAPCRAGAVLPSESGMMVLPVTSELPHDDRPAARVLVAQRSKPSGTKVTTPVSQPVQTGAFRTLAPGSTLPAGADCAVRVRRSSWEPRPQNYTANHTRGRTGASIDGASSTFNARHAPRLDGNFVGTTDEILQWGSCKWGFDEDITRARAIQESFWRQSQLGDSTGSATACAKIGQTAPCWQSYGVLQVKGTVHEDTYPLAKTSTAYNVDYSLAWLRACYEGAFSHWLGNGYRAGDQWGCVGAWYSGNWYDSGATGYIDGVKRHLANRVWLQKGF